MDKTSYEILLEMCTSGRADLRAGMLTGIRLAQIRMSAGDFDDWCAQVADAALEPDHE